MHIFSLCGPPKRINDSTYSLDVMPGANIMSTIYQAIGLACGLDAAIQFEFNGVTVTVRSDSIPSLVYRDWSRALSGYIDKQVGPYPNLVLTDEEKENDARIEAENECRWQERQAQYEAEARAKREAVDAKLASTPDIAVADEDTWREFNDKNQDPYGVAVITYAERWARIMQLEMASGKSLEEVAEASAYEADLESITGAMYGFAVSTLADCWKHGERLRRWHNLKTQIGNEGEQANENGGVLNPALISLSTEIKED